MKRAVIVLGIVLLVLVVIVVVMKRKKEKSATNEDAPSTTPTAPSVAVRGSRGPSVSADTYIPIGVLAPIPPPVDAGYNYFNPFG